MQAELPTLWMLPARVLKLRAHAIDMERLNYEIDPLILLTLKFFKQLANELELTRVCKVKVTL